MTNLDKKSIRQQQRRNRNAVPLPHQQAISQQICESIYALPQYQQATRIALYSAIDGEINLTQLWLHAIQHNKQTYMPALQANHELLFKLATPETLTHKNIFNISEPEMNNNQTISLQQINLMFVPLIAFDHHGTRLGRGGGYYDRTLAKQRPECLLGVGYAFQQQSYIEPDPWDISLDGVVTDEGICWYSTF